jgi:hypothetical protein
MCRIILLCDVDWQHALYLEWLLGCECETWLACIKQHVMCNSATIELCGVKVVERRQEMTDSFLCSNRRKVTNSLSTEESVSRRA